MGSKDTTPIGKASFVHNITSKAIKAIKIECCVEKNIVARKKNPIDATIEINIFFKDILYKILFFRSKSFNNLFISF